MLHMNGSVFYIFTATKKQSTCFELSDALDLGFDSTDGAGLAVANDDVIATAAMPRAVLEALEAADCCIALAAAVTAAIAPPLGFFASAAKSFCLSRS